MRRFTKCIAIILLIILAINTVNASVVIRTGTFSHVENEIYTVSSDMVFSRVTAYSDYILFNSSMFNITSANPINITLDFIHKTTDNVVNGTKVMSFYGNTTAGVVSFRISGFESNSEYEVRRDGIVFTTVVSNDTGTIWFNNSDWSERYLEIYKTLADVPPISPPPPPPPIPEEVAEEGLTDWFNISFIEQFLGLILVVLVFILFILLVLVKKKSEGESIQKIAILGKDRKRESRKLSLDERVNRMKKKKEMRMEKRKKV